MRRHAKPLLINQVNSVLTVQNIRCKVRFRHFASAAYGRLLWLIGYSPGAASQIKKIARPKQDNSRDRFLSYDEARRRLEALKDKSILIHDLALMVLFTGMCFEECRNLAWADIDFDNGLRDDSLPADTRYINCKML